MIVWSATSKMVGPVGSASVWPVEQQAAAGQQGGGSSPAPAVIGLIGGTGKLGSALAARFARAGHEDAVGERVVVSTAVPVRFIDGSGPTHIEVEQGSASEQVAALLPRARVVGALHTVSSATLAKLDRDLGADVLITGDDPDAKTVVAELLASLSGVRVVDGGPLRNSRYVEQLTVLILSINMRVRRNTGVRVTNLPDELALLAAPQPLGRAT